MQRAFLSPNHTREGGQPDGPLSFITLLCVFYEAILSVMRTCPQCNVKVRKLALHILLFHPQTLPTFAPIFSFIGKEGPISGSGRACSYPLYCPQTAADPALLPLSLSSEFRFAVHLLCRLSIKLLCKASLRSACTL